MRISSGRSEQDRKEQLKVSTKEYQRLYRMEHPEYRERERARCDTVYHRELDRIGHLFRRNPKAWAERIVNGDFSTRSLRARIQQKRDQIDRARGL